MRIALASFGMGFLALAAAAPAFSQGIHLPGIDVQVGPGREYVRPPPVYDGDDVAPPYGGGPMDVSQDPREFTFHVEQRMNNLGARLRQHVDQGLVNPRALDELQARRDDVERELQSASVDGVITPDEREHIDTDLQQMHALDVRPQHNAYGGGPPWNTDPDWR